MNKKATEKFLSIYWFAILLIVAFGIWAMAYSYYQHPLEIRELETRILSNKIANCISYKGEMRNEFFENEAFRVLTEDEFEKICHFNPLVEDQYDWRKRKQYYVEISFFDISENSKFSQIKYGEPSIKDFCEGSEDFERLPKCNTMRFYVIDNKKEQTLVEIFTGVGKAEKNVKI